LFIWDIRDHFMYVITFANPTGGSGKATSAMLLAEQIAISGGRVAVLDFDPNANILAWSRTRQERGRAVPFAVHAPPQAEETIELIDSLAQEVGYLIIDLEGSKDQIVTFALSRTDLCVIPLDGSPVESRQAAAAVRLVQTAANMIRAPINYALLFTQKMRRSRAASYRSGSYPHALKQLAHSAGVKVSAMRPMAAQRPSTVRSVAFHRSALSLAKPFSMGLKSGL
jgi:cellulose biosynthesis protein BcsQ